ncbi:MAG: DMT family transporter [Methylocella sp.]
MSSAWLYPLILVAGALQAWGPPMNGALRSALTNPWLASLVSFLPVAAFLVVVFACVPRPLPAVDGVRAMRDREAARQDWPGDGGWFDKPAMSGIF